MKSSTKPYIFFIMPFEESFFRLLEELKRELGNDYIIENTKDMDNQQSIIEDIVQGINRADVVIADLTGLNPNCFYELGLAHALNKKTIIITQDINDLPFDIRPYKAHEYSMVFYKMPLLMEELKRLIEGAVNGEVTFGNPVSDYVIRPEKTGETIDESFSIESTICQSNSQNKEAPEEEDGFLDHIASIEESAGVFTEEINKMAIELDVMNQEVDKAANEINRANGTGGTGNITFARNTCRKLAEPIHRYADQLVDHVANAGKHWDIIENAYLTVLDSPFLKEDEMASITDAIKTLEEMKSSMEDTDSKVIGFKNAIEGVSGIERRLTRSIKELSSGLESYLTMTGTIATSIDRIKKRSSMYTNSGKIGLSV